VDVVMVWYGVDGSGDVVWMIQHGENRRRRKTIGFGFLRNVRLGVRVCYPFVFILFPLSDVHVGLTSELT